MDIQQMLDHTMRRARETRVENFTATPGGFRILTIPSMLLTWSRRWEKSLISSALEELVRVLRPGGRLVVGEGQPDPHMVGLHTLKELADAAGLDFERRTGGPLGYFAGFAVP